LPLATAGALPGFPTVTAYPVPVAKPPERGAIDDCGLRVTLGEIASIKACELVRVPFRTVRGLERFDVTGHDVDP
jgi:hypothetical protein